MDVQSRYHNQDKLFDQEIKRREELCLRLKPVFLRRDFESIKLNHQPEFILLMTDYAYALWGFADDQIKNKFRHLGFDVRLIKWLVSLNEFKRELESTLATGKLKVLKYEVLLFMTHYIECKISSAILDITFPAVYDGQRVNRAYADLKNILRRSPGRRFKNEYDKRMQHLVDDFQDTALEGVNCKKLLLKWSSGNIEQFYIKQIVGCFYDREMSKSKFRKTLFPLLNLIMQDKPFLSEDEFDEIKRKEKNDNYYKDSNYNEYQVAQVRYYDQE